MAKTKKLPIGKDIDPNYVTPDYLKDIMGDWDLQKKDIGDEPYNYVETNPIFRMQSRGLANIPYKNGSTEVTPANPGNIDLSDKEPYVAKPDAPKPVLSETEKLFNDYINSNKRNTAMGIAGEGIQMASAIGDYIHNSQQPSLPRPSMVIGTHVPYHPIDTTNYDNKLNEAIAGYKKHLNETGNSHMIPSLIGMEDKRNEMYANVANMNTQDQARVDATNASTDLQTQQVNSNINNEYTKEQIASNQYKDASMRSNKGLFFNSVAGIGANIAGSNENDLKAKLIQHAITTKDDNLLDMILGNRYKNKIALPSSNTLQTQTPE